MDRSPERWEKMKEYFFRDKLIRVSAIDAALWCSGSVDNTGRPIWYSAAKQEKIDAGLLHPENSVIPAELACALSHSLVWKKMIDENIESAIILEDDVRPAGSYDLPISDCINLPNGVDLMLLSGADKMYNFGDEVYRQCAKVGGDSQLFFAHGTYGYVITKKAAAMAIESIKPVSLPLPHQLYTSIAEGYRQRHPIRNKFEATCKYSENKIRATAQKKALIEVSGMDDNSTMTNNGKKPWRTA